MFAAEAVFQLAYGRFMQRWARLEQAMFFWFWWVSALPEGRARAIFYSAKNFAGRGDMLNAALDYAEVAGRYVAFGRQAIKKARQFNSFRNGATHGEAIFDAGTKEYVMLEGKHTLPHGADTIVTVRQLEIAAENVRELGRLMFDVRQHAGATGYPADGVASPETCLERIRALPNLADHIPPDRTPSDYGLPPPLPQAEG
jgi:hypothetical protein